MWATFIVVAFLGFGDALESFAVSATSSFAELSSLISKGNYNIGDEITVNAGMVIPQMESCYRGILILKQLRSQAKACQYQSLQEIQYGQVASF